MRYVLILLLAGLLWFQWALAPVQPPSVRIRPAPLPAAAPVASAGDWRLGDPGAYRVIGRHTLFRPDRRPPAQDGAAAPASQGPQEVEGLDLVAVVITAAGREAWVRDGKAKDLLRLKVGAKVRGWRVKAVRPAEIVLERGGKEARIPLLQYPDRVEPPPAKPGRRPLRRPAPRRLPPPPRT